MIGSGKKILITISYVSNFYLFKLKYKSVPKYIYLWRVKKLPAMVFMYIPPEETQVYTTRKWIKIKHVIKLNDEFLLVFIINWMNYFWTFNTRIDSFTSLYKMKDNNLPPLRF